MTGILVNTHKKAGRLLYKKPLAPYRIDQVDYYVATDRFDLTAEQVAFAYKLRWDIEKFFGWWKQHLNVYHVIARSAHNERVSITRVRELRIKIRNELIELLDDAKEQKQCLNSS